jgi:hypothetical protein
MSESRACDQCGKHLITQRAGARFCNKDCSNAWHNKQRRRDRATDKHLTPGSGPQNTSMGEVRSIAGARKRAAVKAPTDCQLIALALEVAGPKGLHSHTIRKRGLSGHPSERIRELQARGYQIDHIQEFKGHRPGVRYVLISSPGSSVNEAKAA